MMETHHYESDYNTLYNNMNSGRDTMKRKMTLDLNTSQGQDGTLQSSVIKKARINAASLHTPGYSASDVLNSPGGFKNVPTPDLEYAMKALFPETTTYIEPMVQQQQRQLNNGYTHIQVLNPPPTYSQLVTPVTTYTTTNNSQYAASASSMDSDENSVSDNSMTSSTNSTYNPNGQYARLPDYNNAHGYGIGAGGVVIKEEPTSSPQNAHSHSPIDMANQERIKLERKRQRNRVAASKCRKRKLEKISKLEEKVSQLKKENAELTGVMDNLNDSVRLLKDQVRRHAEAGCQIMVSANINHY